MSLIANEPSAELLQEVEEESKLQVDACFTYLPPNSDELQDPTD